MTTRSSERRREGRNVELESAARRPRPGLTAADVNCPASIARGLTRLEVATDFNRTINAVKTDRGNAYRRLGAADRDDAFAEATAVLVLPGERRCPTR